LRISQPFDGHIDEVAFFDLALDAEQIAQLMAEGVQRFIDNNSLAATVDGTDLLRRVEILGFADGNQAYVLGAGSENAASLSASDIQALAGTRPLVVLGDGSEILRLEGGWSHRGVERIGQETYSRWVHGGDAASVLVLEGVDVQPDLELFPIVPIAYWSFNETSGDLVEDTAGTPQNGTFFGSKRDLDDPGPDVPFDAMTSADFHRSSSDYIGVAHDPEFELDSGTVQFWFNPESTFRRQTLMSKDHSGFVDGGHLNIALDGQRLEVRLQSGSESFFIRTDKLVQKDEWHHIAFTFGSTGMKLYLDGVLVGERNYTGGLGGNREAIVMGGSNRENKDDSGDPSRLRITQSFDGRIDEVAIFGEALEANQIQQLISNGPLGVLQV
jgi:hypothetical protein